MIHFIKSLLVFVRLYRLGWFFSENTRPGEEGSRWGHMRLCMHLVPGALTLWSLDDTTYEFVSDPLIREVFDIDYFTAPDGKLAFFHARGDDIRWDRAPKQKGQFA